MSRKRDIERAVASLPVWGDDFAADIPEIVESLNLAYDLGRIAGLREAARSEGLDLPHPLVVGERMRTRQLANREARKLRRK